MKINHISISRSIAKVERGGLRRLKYKVAATASDDELAFMALDVWVNTESQALTLMKQLLNAEIVTLDDIPILEPVRKGDRSVPPHRRMGLEVSRK